MYNIEEEFAKYQEKVEKENKKYENYEITAENFNFPHIYLTDEEIKEFNAECKKAKIDLKVIPLSEYMDISSVERDDRDINEDMKFLDNCFIQKDEFEEEKKEEEKNINNNINFENIIKNVNEYIGKKQKRVINDDSDESEASNDRSSFSFKSSIELNKNKLKKEKEHKNNKYKNKSQNHPKKIVNDEKYIKKKKNINNNKKEGNNKNNEKNIIDKYFKKLIDTSEYEQNIPKRGNELVEEIQEKSQNLTKEGLQDMAKNRHIRLVGDEFKIDDLKKMSVNKLESLLNDININSDINKLEPNRKDNIKTIRNKEERERRSKERILKKKMMKEEKKKIESLNNNEQNKSNNNNEQNMDKDSDDDKSESSYDDDSLN